MSTTKYGATRKFGANVVSVTVIKGRRLSAGGANSRDSATGDSPRDRPDLLPGAPTRCGVCQNREASSLALESGWIVLDADPPVVWIITGRPCIADPAREDPAILAQRFREAGLL